MNTRKKRNERKTKIKFQVNKKILAITAASLVIVFLIVFILAKAMSNKKNNQPEQKNDNISLLFEEINKQGEELIKPEDVTINIAAVGGIFCEKEIIEDALNDDTGDYNFYNSFNRITDKILNANIVVGTLDTNFVDKPYNEKNRHNAPKELAETLKLIGIDLLNTSTNYSYDYGIDGIISTKSVLEDNKIDTIGTYGNKEEQGTILIKEIANIRIAFLSYTYKTDKTISKADSYSVNIIDKEKIKNDIEKAKQNEVDFIFVSLNWGGEKTNSIANKQKDLVDFLVENDVDFIIGTNFTSIQPMEMRKSSNSKDVLVANSLGNFLSSTKSKDANIGLILNIEITKSAETGEKYLSKVVYTPTYILDNGKDSATRYEILDLREEINKYQNKAADKASEELYTELMEALQKAENIVEGNI